MSFGPNCWCIVLRENILLGLPVNLVRLEGYPQKMVTNFANMEILRSETTRIFNLAVNRQGWLIHSEQRLSNGLSYTCLKSRTTICIENSGLENKDTSPFWKSLAIFCWVCIWMSNQQDTLQRNLKHISNKQNRADSKIMHIKHPMNQGNSKLVVWRSQSTLRKSESNLVFEGLMIPRAV